MVGLGMSCFEKWDIVRWPLHGSPHGSKQWGYGAYFDHDPFAQGRALIIMSESRRLKRWRAKHHQPRPQKQFRSIDMAEMEFVAKGGELLADRRAEQLSRRSRGV